MFMKEKKTPKLNLEYECTYLSSLHHLALIFLDKYEASALKEEFYKQMNTTAITKPKQSFYLNKPTDMLNKSLEKKDVDIRFIGMHSISTF